MIRRPPRSTQSRSSAASDVYKRQKHDRVVFRLAGGRELRLHDTRKFARVRLVADAAAALGALGPEPLAEDFTAECLRSRLARHRRMLKPLLLDQTFLCILYTSPSPRDRTRTRMQYSA